MLISPLSVVKRIVTDDQIAPAHLERLKESDINVDTDKHVVTLKGTVTTAAGRNKAGVVAKGTEGVQRVVNQLTIASSK